MRSGKSSLPTRQDSRPGCERPNCCLYEPRLWPVGRCDKRRQQLVKSRRAATVCQVSNTPIKGDPVTDSSGPRGDHEATCPCTESLCGDRSLHCGDDECVCVCDSAQLGTPTLATEGVAGDAEREPQGAHDPLCPNAKECTHSCGGCSCQADAFCQCDLIKQVRADQDATHERCLCNDINVLGRADGKVNFIAVGGVALEDRNEVLDEALDALHEIDGAAFMYIPRVDEHQTLVFLADVEEALEGLRYDAEVAETTPDTTGVSEPKKQTTGQKIALRPMTAREAANLVVLPSADAGNRKYSMLRKAREAAAAKRAETDRASGEPSYPEGTRYASRSEAVAAFWAALTPHLRNMDDSVDATELTDEDVRKSMQTALDWAGVTLPELEAQARTGEFTSYEAETVWSRIGHFVKKGIRPEADAESRVVVESREALEARRAEILNQLGMTLEQLAELADSQTLMPEELEAQEELQEIAFLLGE